jgi:predicted DNA-binding transcriptional regulator AlpA
MSRHKQGYLLKRGVVMNVERQTVTVREAAKIIGLSHVALYAAIKSGKFTQVIRIGRRIVVPVAALDKLLANAGSKA